MTLQPMPYQIEGAVFLATRRTAFLGDDTGLGKSMQIILAADFLPAERLIVFCPTIGRVSWRDQFPTWQGIPRQVVFYPNAKNKIPEKGPVAVIVTYDFLSRAGNATKFFKALNATKEPFDLLVLDEAHALKTPTSRRTKVVYGKNLLDLVQTIWIASATIRPNNVSEIFTHINALFPDVLTKLFGKRVGFTDFRDRFCLVRQTPFGVQIDGDNPKTIPALKAALAPHVLIRKKGDVLKDLPPIMYFPLPLEVAPTPDPDGIDQVLNNTIDKAVACGTHEDDDTILRTIRTLTQDEHVASRRRQLGLSKVPPAVEWVKDFLDADPTRKLIVFAHHKDVIKDLSEQLEAMFIRTVGVTGAVSQDQRVLAVDLFQNDPKFRVFIGQTIAAGTSITLTASDTVLLLEPDYVPANNYQAISRAHRIGQKGSVSAYFAYADDTTDKRIANIIRRKTQDEERFYENLSTVA